MIAGDNSTERIMSQLQLIDAWVLGVVCILWSLLHLLKWSSVLNFFLIRKRLFKCVHPAKWPAPDSWSSLLPNGLNDSALMGTANIRCGVEPPSYSLKKMNVARGALMGVSRSVQGACWGTEELGWNERSRRRNYETWDNNQMDLKIMSFNLNVKWKRNGFSCRFRGMCNA